VLNGEKMKPFPLKSQMRLGSLFSPLLFNVVLEFLTKSNNGREKKWIQIGKEKVKLFADGLVLY
jgi:hypothetical protein